MEAVNGQGKKVILDASASIGGKEDGFRPMEIMLAGLAGCSGIDILSMLEKGRQKVTDFQVKVNADRAETDPKVFTRIGIHYTVKGEVTDKRMQTAVDLSIEKYCSVAAMLSKTAKIEATYEIKT
ncbi:MAG: OsmC family protein [Spirochaetia bacterium]|nr:OsmC family protein [Spirochaetia bacterium]